MQALWAERDLILIPPGIVKDKTMMPATPIPARMVIFLLIALPLLNTAFWRWLWKFQNPSSNQRRDWKI